MFTHVSIYLLTASLIHLCQILSKVLGGSKRQYIFEKRGDDPWTGTRGATRWATGTTDFLTRHISIVARTGKRTQQASSDEGLW